MGEAYAHDKSRIRRLMQARRRGLTRTEVERCSAAACERILSLPLFSKARHLVAYSAVDNEIDPVELVEAGRASGKAVYYPSLDSPAPAFARGTGGPAVLEAMDGVVVLVPGVAFDVRGARLGRGRGWYDRVLARHATATRLGLSYDFQVLAALPEEVWDVRVHAVVTEARLIGAACSTLRVDGKED
jgi:5-formyltetrahydrofolate cyclo-ligase